MAVTLNPNEVMLNSTRYPITSKVALNLASSYPNKTITGDYSLSSNQVLSAWTNNDHRLGLLCEEMNESNQTDPLKFWWSTANTDFRGHKTLPALATSVTIPSATPTITNADMETASSGWTGGQRTNDFAHGGSYSYKYSSANPFYQDLVGFAPGSTYTFKCWVYTADYEVNTGRINIDDGIGETNSSVLSVSGEWTQLTVTRTLNTAATRLRLECAMTVGEPALYFDDATITTSSAAVGDATCWANFNGNTYVGLGRYLAKVSSDKSSVTFIQYMSAAITDLVPSGSCLLIYLGDGGATVTDGTATIPNGFKVLDQSSNSITVNPVGGTLTIVLPAGTTGTATSAGYVIVAGSPVALSAGSNTITISINAGGSSWAFTVALVTAQKYVYMSDATLPVFTQTDRTGSTWGFVWDNKTFKIGTAGQLCYSVMPNTASPTWTTCGLMDMANVGTISNIQLYRTASGDMVPYVVSTNGVWALEVPSTGLADAIWIQTELTMPNHPTGGKGLVHWHSALYISAGLAVTRYIAASEATIESMGLDTQDGLPPTRSGEIVKFIKGFNEFYALVDSTYEGTGSRSCVYSYNGAGWRCIYEHTADNINLYSGVVSASNGYSLFFSGAGFIKYIDLQRSSQNPKKITGYNYAASADFISPWFDDSTPLNNKTGVKFRIKTSGCSANETVTCYYRIDHATTALASTWTALGSAITTNTTTEISFATAGIAFKSIQFKISLARGSTTTNSPDVEWFTFSYVQKELPSWGYTFTVDCTASYDSKSPGQLVDAVKTVTELTTLAQLCFRNDAGGTETYYGYVRDITGQVQTGLRKEGQYTLYVVVP